MSKNYDIDKFFNELKEQNLDVKEVRFEQQNLIFWATQIESEEKALELIQRLIDLGVNQNELDPDL